MEPSSHPGSRKLSGHATALRRQWWIVALAAFGGLAAATAYTAGVPATYTSSATVNVHALSTDSSQPVGGRATGAVDLQTEVQVIQSATVASLAKQISRSPRSVPALVSRISVTVPANSQVLQISCAEHTAEAATRCAHAFAAAYLQNRSATANGLIQTQLSALQRESAALQQTITALTLKIKSLSRGSSERITLTTELGADNTQLNLLSSQIAGLVGQSANTSGGRIITDAAPPQRPAGPGPWLYLPCGLAAGLVIGLVLALWRSCSICRAARRVRGSLSPGRGRGPGKHSPSSHTPSWPRSGGATMSCSWRVRRQVTAAAWPRRTWRRPWPGRARKPSWSAPTCAAASPRRCSG